MTRNEAIAKIIAIRSPGNSDIGYRYSIGVEVDVYQALGILFLVDEVAPSKADERLKIALKDAGYSPKTFEEILGVMKHAGLGLVENQP